jgi:hypothetical protein
VERSDVYVIPTQAAQRWDLFDAANDGRLTSVAVLNHWCSSAINGLAPVLLRQEISLRCLHLPGARCGMTFKRYTQIDSGNARSSGIERR